MPDDGARNLIGLDQLAYLLNLTPRWINRLVKEQGMPRVAPGHYDLVECVQWYIEFIRRQSKGSDQPESFNQERAALTRANRRLRELDLAKKRGELLEVSLVRQAVGDLVHAAKAHLLGLPSSLADILAREKSPAKVKKNSKTRSATRFRTWPVGSRQAA
jgi:phage terminase Nu1 subunit (DNA packaging protein)